MSRRTNGPSFEVERDVSKNALHMETSYASGAFAELLAKSEKFGGVFPLDRACLLVSASIDPHTDISACETELDELSRRAAALANGSREPYAQVGALIESLYTIGGFGGNAAAYGASGNSLLARVITTRLGIPITLSIVLMETARRIGLALEGVGLPGHFIVRFPDPSSRLFIDPYHGGAIVDESDCGILRHRSATDGTGIIAEGLVHEVLVLGLPANAPFEAKRFHRTGTRLGIAVGLHLGGDIGFLFGSRLVRLAGRGLLVEDAGDGRERMVGRVALAQCFSPFLAGTSPER